MIDDDQDMASHYDNLLQDDDADYLPVAEGDKLKIQAVPIDTESHNSRQSKQSKSSLSKSVVVYGSQKKTTNI